MSLMKKDVKGIFGGEGHGKIMDVRGDVGDIWYVTFESEDQALASLDKVKRRVVDDHNIR